MTNPPGGTGIVDTINAGGRHHHHRPPPLARNIWLSLHGVGVSGRQQGFDALCGQNPPTITDGYGRWLNIPWLLRRDLTIPQGYAPMTMTIDIIFGYWGQGSWQTDQQAGEANEARISILEWMGGSIFPSGPTPLVYVFSRGANGKDTGLVPKRYKGMPWIIATQGLQWGQAWWNVHGDRIWQEATVTLQNYLNSADPPPDVFQKGSYFNSRAGRDTALLIAGAVKINSPQADHMKLAGRILTDTSNNPCKGTSIRLQRRSINWHIKHGTPVFVPYHQVS